MGTEKIEIPKKIIKMCPLIKDDCVMDKCAWWLKIQSACAIQVQARGLNHAR